MGKMHIGILNSINMLKLKLAFSLICVQMISACPEGTGWIKAGNSCYLVSQDRMTWFSSQEFCWSQGGYLAEIQSKYEEDLVDQVLMHDIDYWIGLNDLSVEKDYVWSESHEAAEYTNWREHEPDNRRGQDCVAKENGATWADRSCDKQEEWGTNFHALCEKPDEEK